jgi:SAM-dependent methyltransferase
MGYPGQTISNCLPILIAMRRIQFFELHEQPWFPPTLRNEITDALQCGAEILKAYAPISGLLQRALDATGSRSIVDVCSGSGGPWLDLSQKVRGGTGAYRIWLTDKFPNLAVFENAKANSANRIDFYTSSVDATRVPNELDGFRTMFSSFHHFPPAQARAILQSAIDARQGIGIFEITSRTASAVGMMFLWFLTPFVFTPSIRPFRWSRLLYTYLLPIIPLVLLFDGLVSCLRSYQPLELRELINGLAASEYLWEVGEQSGKAGLPVTYLIGYPRERTEDSL